jgi:DNA-binding CsgD family transcriptional regulator
MAAGGVVLSSKLHNRYHHEIFSTLLYFQVFIFTFGFYGLWGQVVIKAFLSGYISADMLARFSVVAILLGLPFLVFGWLMLIKFSCGISGIKSNDRLVFWFLLVNFSIIITLGYFIATTRTIEPISSVKNYFILMNFVYSVIAAFLILFQGKEKSAFNYYNRKVIAALLLITMFSQCTTLLLYKEQSVVAIGFIFIFFAGNTVLPVYLNYGTLLSAFTAEPVRDMTFEGFCKRFEVSPRETDIVREICNGLSNKEISEKLFISLQTVKDHTHRIYIKTNVRSRVQLINLVKELKIM